jgi:hypothetical protein
VLVVVLMFGDFGLTVFAVLLLVWLRGFQRCRMPRPCTVFVFRLVALE